MIVTLSTFADQVSGVARDVGVEGKLGGQADVPGAAGIWRDLTNNVNELAGNLTRQVRAIGDVATVFGGRVSLDEQAALAGTIPYELLTALGARLPRRYQRTA